MKQCNCGVGDACNFCQGNINWRKTMDFLLNNKTLLFNAVFILLPILNVLLGVVGYDNFQPTDEVIQLGLALVALVNAIAKIVVDKQKA